MVKSLLGELKGRETGVGSGRRIFFYMEVINSFPACSASADDAHLSRPILKKPIADRWMLPSGIL